MIYNAMQSMNYDEIDDAADHPGSDRANLMAEDLMFLASRTQYAPKEALDRLAAAQTHLSYLQSKAATDIIDIAKAEEEVRTANLVYIAALSTLRLACMAAGFDSYLARIWLLYFGCKETDIAKLARRMHTTEKRVEYLLFSIKMNSKFALAWDRMAEYADVLD